MLYYAAWWTAYITTAVGIESFIYRAKQRAGNTAQTKKVEKISRVF